MKSIRNKIISSILFQCWDKNAFMLSGDSKILNLQSRRFEHLKQFSGRSDVSVLDLKTLFGLRVFT